MTPQIQNATPKGSLVVVRSQHSYNSLIMGAYAGYVRFWVGVVDGAKRDGTAIRVRRKGGYVHRITLQDEVMAIPAAKMVGVLPELVLAEMGESYDELGEVRTALLAAINALATAEG